jgi:hypothetical protein
MCVSKEYLRCLCYPIGDKSMSGMYVFHQIYYTMRQAMREMDVSDEMTDYRRKIRHVKTRPQINKFIYLFILCNVFL